MGNEGHPHWCILLWLFPCLIIVTIWNPNWAFPASSFVLFLSNTFSCNSVIRGHYCYPWWTMLFISTAVELLSGCLLQAADYHIHAADSKGNRCTVYPTHKASLLDVIQPFLLMESKWMLWKVRSVSVLQPELSVETRAVLFELLLAASLKSLPVTEAPCWLCFLSGSHGWKDHINNKHKSQMPNSYYGVSLDPELAESSLNAASVGRIGKLSWDQVLQGH